MTQDTSPNNRLGAEVEARLKGAYRPPVFDEAASARILCEARGRAAAKRSAHAPRTRIAAFVALASVAAVAVGAAIVVPRVVGQMGLVSGTLGGWSWKPLIAGNDRPVPSALLSAALASVGRDVKVPLATQGHGVIEASVARYEPGGWTLAVRYAPDIDLVVQNRSKWRPQEDASRPAPKMRDGRVLYHEVVTVDGVAVLVTRTGEQEVGASSTRAITNAVSWRTGELHYTVSSLSASVQELLDFTRVCRR